MFNFFVIESGIVGQFSVLRTAERSISDETRFSSYLENRSSINPRLFRYHGCFSGHRGHRPFDALRGRFFAHQWALSSALLLFNHECRGYVWSLEPRFPPMAHSGSKYASVDFESAAAQSDPIDYAVQCSTEIPFTGGVWRCGLRGAAEFSGLYQRIYRQSLHHVMFFFRTNIYDTEFFKFDFFIFLKFLKTEIFF